VRAVVVDEGGQPVPTQVPEPEGDGELVRVLACGLCGSDVEKIGRAPAGTVLGHEVVAETPDARPHPGRGGTVLFFGGLPRGTELSSRCSPTRRGTT
jgi:threonine dehydrogenase-like Zn-dependent dehydrogenase